MARPRAKLDTHNQGQEVSARLAKEPAGLARERLLAVSKGLEGDLSLEEIANELGRSRATIQSWFDLFREGGMEKLCRGNDGPRGPQSLLTPKAHRELKKKLAKGSFRRAEDVRVWLEQRFGIKAKLKTVYGWLVKCAARLKVPRPKHPKTTDQARATFKLQFARRAYQALQGKGKDNKRPVRLWVADEARIGLIPVHRRAWVLRGCRAHKSSARSYDWQYVWAALQVGGGGSEFLYSNGADLDVSCHFLEQISRRDPHAIHVVLWDGAGFHPKPGDPRLPENVVLVQQPSHSPELNPVEKLWDLLRDFLCNRQWKCLEELLEQTTRFLKQFWESPPTQFSLVGDGWLLRQANAC